LSPAGSHGSDSGTVAAGDVRVVFVQTSAPSAKLGVLASWNC
jgi:hypothetical protein